MPEKKKGKVFLTGAGPGDAGLITLKAVQVLRSADVVIYDRLINPVLLKFAERAEKVFAGKDPSRKSKTSGTHPDYLPQEKINGLLIRFARQGKSVVRLKGGDPFIFGRGGEEASALKRAGILFEVIPGVSSAWAVPAYAGIPVTDRRFASMVTLVTAHQENGEDTNWRELARISGTLVFFMGVKTLPRLADSLIRAGKSPGTPVCVIERGTFPEQRVVQGTLRSIGQKIKKARIQPPALAVIGPVNRLSHELDWFHPGKKSKQDLSGKTILVTRAGSQSLCFKEALESKGAIVRVFPVIRILPPKSWKGLDEAIRKIKQKQWDWILFTSVNGVDAFFQRMKASGMDSRCLGSVKIAAIGEITRERLLEKGIKPDLVPGKFTSEGLVAALKKENQIKGLSFLLPRTDIAPPYLYEELRKLGANVTQVTAYQTVAACGPREKETLRGWMDRREIDYVTFTSASTVDHFFALLPKQKKGKMTARLISIGPVTSQAIRRHGCQPWQEARTHTLKGMLDAV